MDTTFDLKILFLIIGWIILSWILIHLMAVFGVFLAFAYPLWWLIAPKKTPCLFCNALREGAFCPFCRRQVIKKQGLSPVNFKSAVLNGALILLFAFVSFGVVYGESRILFKLGFPPTAKTASFIIPAKGQYRIGEVFPMKIDINNLQNAINAVQADVGFDPNKLEVVNISTDGSFANVFIQKEINNQGGWARLTGGLPNPGYLGQNGTFGTIYFKGKSAGLVTIQFLPSSLVLVNDSRGNNVLKDLPSASYLILPEKVTSEEEQQQSKLFSQTNVLGASTSSGQLNFYDQGSVLGAHTSTAQEIKQSQRFNLFSFLANILEQVDRFTLNLWDRFIDLFGNK